mmetsp:Transcript_30350/g.33972  ORF Transcript_30350/g.33972 Transcript_30350/m.33972 type:complete len:365 (+) Transcript_30350:123-1217(+)
MSTSTVFGEDDEEIWKKVVDVDDSIAPLLPNLAVRIQEDWNIDGGRNSSLNNTSSTSDGESYWERLTNNNRNKNRFAYSNASTKAIDTSVSNTNDDSIPEAFKTEEGEKHLSATTALLGLSRQRSVQVTMGALRSVDTTAGNSSKDKDDKHKNDNFSSLLGSRELLVKTLTHHHRQRSARLSVLTECLRLEQDEFYPIRAVVTKELLDPLDESFLNSNDGNNNNNNNWAFVGAPSIYTGFVAAGVPVRRTSPTKQEKEEEEVDGGGGGGFGSLYKFNNSRIEFTATGNNNNNNNQNTSSSAVAAATVVAEKGTFEIEPQSVLDNSFVNEKKTVMERMLPLPSWLSSGDSNNSNNNNNNNNKKKR